MRHTIFLVLLGLSLALAVRPVFEEPILREPIFERPIFRAEDAQLDGEEQLLSTDSPQSGEHPGNHLEHPVHNHQDHHLRQRLHRLRNRIHRLRHELANNQLDGEEQLPSTSSSQSGEHPGNHLEHPVHNHQGHLR